MKQLFIAGASAYGAAVSGSLDAHDMTTLAEGAIAVTDLKDGSLVEEAISGDVAVFLGRAAGLVPNSIPEVNKDTLEVTLASPQSAVACAIAVAPTVSTLVGGELYTLIFTKKGTSFNERSNWTVEYVANESDAAKDVVKGIVDAVTEKGLPFTNNWTENATSVTFTATDGNDWAVTIADDYAGTATATAMTPAIGDVAYIKDLARQCAAGKGFNYLAEDGKELYPGFPEPIAAASYYVFTLRWSVPRKSAKTRDEVVSQLLHIAVPYTNSSLAQSLMTIFSVSASY